KSAAEGEAGVAILVGGTAVEGLSGLFNRGRRENRNLTLAGNVGRDLEDVHAASRENSGGEELHALAVAGSGACDLHDRQAADLRGGWLRRLTGLGCGRGLGLFAARNDEEKGDSKR